MEKTIVVIFIILAVFWALFTQFILIPGTILYSFWAGLLLSVLGRKYSEERDGSLGGSSISWILVSFIVAFMVALITSDHDFSFQETPTYYFYATFSNLVSFGTGYLLYQLLHRNNVKEKEIEQTEESEVED